MALSPISAPASLRLIVGTYTISLPHVQARGGGIHIFDFALETGVLTERPLIGETSNPTYLALSPDHKRLYAVEELPEEDGADLLSFALDEDGDTPALLSVEPTQGGWPCHVSVDAAGRRVFVSNYLSGSLVVFALDTDGVPEPRPMKIQLGGSSIDPRQEGPHVHQAVPTPDGRAVLVCNAGADEILRFALADPLVDSTPDCVVEVEPGSFPRHVAFLPDGHAFLAVHEIGNAVELFDYAADGIMSRERISILPADWSGSSIASAIKIHPSGRFAYASNRGHDSIACIALDSEQLAVTGWTSTHGHAPRDFSIDPSGRFLVVANQDSHTLVVFAIDEATGALSHRLTHDDVGSPVCVLFA